MGGLPALDSLLIHSCTHLTDISALAGSPLSDLRIDHAPRLNSVGALNECSGLRKLMLGRCGSVQDFPSRGLTDLELDRVGWEDLSLLAHQTPLRKLGITDDGTLKDAGALAGMPALLELDLRHCPALTDGRFLLDMPSLRRAVLPGRLLTAASDGSADPVVAELRTRGVTVF
ncbi:hypothetical protein [Streptomyces sp. NPDC093991]|uniref:hypothetical protein n=1 Tax=unclassified Streptomyces TaxID=2593676 RepID=UPI00343FE71A